MTAWAEVRPQRARPRSVTLDERLDVLGRRIAEQEAALARLRELVGLPPRQSAYPSSPLVPRVAPMGATPAGLQLGWLAARYFVGVLARSAASIAFLALALAVVAEVVRLVKR